MKQIVYIHGLNSSHTSFSYILEKLPDHKMVMVDYDSHQPLQLSIAQVLKKLPKDGSFSLVGHSLGGVIAALIADVSGAEELVTISSPLNGSRAASTLRWIPGSLPVMKDITPSSPYIMQIKEGKLTIPTLSIISTGGHLPTSPEPNDSVVAVSSQKALKHAKKQEIKASHFEVLMHDKTVKHLKDFLFGENE